MGRRLRLAAAALLAASGGGASADEILRAGAYEVRWRLELPHVAGGEGGATTICLPKNEGAMPVLSANNALAHCPASDLRREGARLSFDIVCPGGNAARAAALFDMLADGFDGRIAMNMGGKNMTMTEVQRGARVGDCPPALTPAPPR